jgi:mono/diheme cytochrome c family protein
MRIAVSIVASVVTAVSIAACGIEHRGEPRAPELVPESAAVARGERLFQRYCYQCHPGGGAGVGPALNDKPLPKLAIATQIRTGVGAMPAFDDTWLTDAQVDDITAYVQALRAAPATRETTARR